VKRTSYEAPHYPIFLRESSDRLRGKKEINTFRWQSFIERDPLGHIGLYGMIILKWHSQKIFSDDINWMELLQDGIRRFYDDSYILWVPQLQKIH